MAEDARLSTALPRHPKTRKLHKRLGGNGCWALVCLFLWVASNRCDGNLVGLTEEDIELAADWEGDCGNFVAVLREVGFIDGEPGGFVIHDWAEHNPWAAARGMRVEAAKRAAAVRWESRSNTRGMRSASDSHAEGTRAAEKGNAHHPTQPNPIPKPKTSCTEPEKSPASAPQSEALITLPCVGKGPKEFAVTQQHLTEWSGCFPDLDVLGELRRARAWLEANPSRRKTHSGAARFALNWLGKSQNRGATNGNGGSNGNSHKADAVIDAAAERLARKLAEAG